MDDSIYRLRHRDILALCVLGLLALGVLMVQSASMTVTNQIYWQWTQRGTRHLLYALVALATFFAVGNLRYWTLAAPTRRFPFHPIFLCFATACISCIAVLIPHVGLTVNGARRW